MKLPSYKMLYEQLRTQITLGTYHSGQLLPSENQLCALSHTTRPTVRKALELLAQEGLIVRRKGKGSIVKSSPKGIGILSISGTTSAVGRQNIRTMIVVPPQRRPWQEALGFELSPTEQTADCIYFERVRYVGGTAVFVDITMLPDLRLPHFTELELENASLFDHLRTLYATTVTGGTQRLWAIRADRHIAELLGVRQGAPILQIDRRIDTSRDDFHIYSRLYCTTEQYSISGNF